MQQERWFCTDRCRVLSLNDMRIDMRLVSLVLSLALAADGRSTKKRNKKAHYIADPYQTACVSDSAWRQAFDLGGCIVWRRDFVQFAKNETFGKVFDDTMVDTCICLAAYYTWLAPRALNPMPVEIKVTVSQHPLIYPPSSRTHPFVTFGSSEVDWKPVAEGSERSRELAKILRARLRAISARLRKHTWNPSNQASLAKSFTLLPQMAMYCAAFQAEGSFARDPYINALCRISLQTLESTTVSPEGLMHISEARCEEMKNLLREHNAQWMERKLKKVDAAFAKLFTGPIGTLPAPKSVPKTPKPKAIKNKNKKRWKFWQRKKKSSAIADEDSTPLLDEPEPSAVPAPEDFFDFPEPSISDIPGLANDEIGYSDFFNMG